MLKPIYVLLGGQKVGVGCLAQELDCLDFLPVARHGLQLERQLRIELAPGQNSALENVLPLAGLPWLAQKCRPGVVLLLGVLLFVLAGPGCRINPGTGSRRGLHLSGVVGL